jgi:hypothetical protein
VAYPEELRTTAAGKSAPPSTSDRVIEMLTIEYAMPAQLISGVHVWKGHYESEFTDPDADGGTHNLPGAEGWDELNEFRASDESMLAFALGLAFGEIYQMSEEERDGVKKKYRKQHRPFIYSNRSSQYFLMPFFEHPSKDKAFVARMKDRVVFLGKGREAAFEEFQKDPQHAVAVRQWIESRFVGKDLDETLGKLGEYVGSQLIELENSNQPSLARQAKREKLALLTYVEYAREARSLELD